MLPAAVMIRRSMQLELLRRRRPLSEAIVVKGRTVVLRDQRPLHQGNMFLPRGYAFEDFVESLNERVFFWPGKADRPISHGLRHFERYRNDKPVILRVQSMTLIGANPSVEPTYCYYNSGSPRCSRGNKSPRGPDTFLCAHQFSRRASQVVEVTFKGEITMPPGVQFGYQPSGPWQSLL